MMKTITVSAPGKLMLLGEHAVVYNRPCLVTAVDKRIRVKMALNKEEKIRIKAPAVGIKNWEKEIKIKKKKGSFKKPEVYPKELSFVMTTLAYFYQKFGLKETGLDLKIQNDFSCAYGLGSSAAVSVCLVKALSELFGFELSQKEIFELAYRSILKVQGLGSGFDVAAATYGGTLYFLTGGKIIKPLKVENLPLVVAYSGVKANTPAMVRNLKFRMEKKEWQNKIQNLFSQIAEIVKKAKKALLNQEWLKLGFLMNENQRLLRQLGVSTPKLDEMCQAALRAGASGAKLSGAGGGDCMLALVEKPKRKKVIQALEQAGGLVLDLNLGAKGVTLEN